MGSSLMEKRDQAQAPNHLVDVSEAARILGLKKSTVYQWAYERRLPTIKLGRALRFRVSDLNKLIDDCERPVLLPLDQQSYKRRHSE